jgi:hypothetical protein
MNPLKGTCGARGPLSIPMLMIMVGAHHGYFI